MYNKARNTLLLDSMEIELRWKSLPETITNIILFPPTSHRNQWTKQQVENQETILPGRNCILSFHNYFLVPCFPTTFTTNLCIYSPRHSYGPRLIRQLVSFRSMILRSNDTAESVQITSLSLSRQKRARTNNNERHMLLITILPFCCGLLARVRYRVGPFFPLMVRICILLLFHKLLASRQRRNGCLNLHTRYII